MAKQIQKGIYCASITICNEDLTVDIDSTIKHSNKSFSSCVILLAPFAAKVMNSMLSLSSFPSL